MTARGVLDTSTLILLGRVAAPEPLITAETLAELSVGPPVATSEEERSARQAHLQLAEADFDQLPFDAAAARSFGIVAASLRRSGRKPAARAYDAMIAAIALANGLPVHTCYPTDFVGIDGLDVVAVPLRQRAICRGSEAASASWLPPRLLPETVAGTSRSRADVPHRSGRSSVHEFADIGVCEAQIVESCRTCRCWKG